MTDRGRELAKEAIDNDHDLQKYFFNFDNPKFGLDVDLAVRRFESIYKSAVSDVVKQLEDAGLRELDGHVASHQWDVNIPDQKHFLDAARKRGFDTEKADALLEVCDRLDKDGWVNGVNCTYQDVTYDIIEVAKNDLNALCESDPSTVNPNDCIDRANTCADMAAQMLDKSLHGHMLRWKNYTGLSRDSLKAYRKMLGELGSKNGFTSYDLYQLSGAGRTVMNAFNQTVIYDWLQGIKNFDILRDVISELKRLPYTSKEMSKGLEERLDLLTGQGPYRTPAKFKRDVPANDLMQELKATIYNVLEPSIDIPQPVAVDVGVPAKTVEKTIEKAKNDIER